MVRAAPGFLWEETRVSHYVRYSVDALENVPALATDKVAAVLPVDAVRAGSAVLVVDGAAVVGPERVVEAVVGARAALGTAAGNELADLGVVEVEGHGHDAGGAEDEGLEGNHGD